MLSLRTCLGGFITFEHDINGEVPDPEGDEAKATHNKNLVKAKRIIEDSVIPKVGPRLRDPSLSKS